MARDKVRKLALLKIDVDGLDVPEWVPTSDIRVGQWAIALGRGFGGDSASVTVGIVSALNRMMGNAIQTDAKLAPANYGGPLIDVHGRILGICVPMAQRQGELAGVRFYDAGVGFAVPEHRVRELVDTLHNGDWQNYQPAADVFILNYHRIERYGITLADFPRIQAKGIPIIVYTLIDPNEIRQAIAQGINGILTDRPDIMSKVLETNR